MTNFEKVEQFMNAFGQAVRKSPTTGDPDLQRLRIDLIREELDEFVDAISEDNVIEMADALTDILYVVYGAGHAFGIDLDACFDEVHNSNMSKLGSMGKPIYRADGKVMKGENYFPPDLTKIVK